MTAQLVAKASDVLANGKLRVIPGFTDLTASRRLDELPMFFPSPLLATGAATAVGYTIAPCNLTIVGATLKRPSSAATGKKLSIGTATGATVFLNKFSLPTAAGVTNISATAFATTSIAAGDAIVFSSTLITSCTAAVTLICVPRNG